MTDEERRLSLRQQALSSHFAFCKGVLGFADMTPELHGDVSRFLVGKPTTFPALRTASSLRKLIVMPRGHLKTHLCTIGYALWRATRSHCDDWEALGEVKDSRILISNENFTNAAGFLSKIKQIVERNQIYRWLFPEVLPDTTKVKWNTGQAELCRSSSHSEASMECAGTDTTVVSRHYDIVIEDDLVGPDHILSPDQMQKVIDWHKYAESLAVDPGFLEEIIVGTRWAFNDLVSHVIDNEPSFGVYKRSCLEGGEPIWPQRFTPGVVDAILEKQGPEIFSCQYQNDPVSESTAAFDESWLRYFDEPPKVANVFMSVDPALSLRRDGDYSAIIILAVDPTGLMYVLDVQRDRWSVDELCDAIIRSYMTWKPASVGLEVVSFQVALKWPLREAMRRHGISFMIKELRPNSRVSKEMRIRALQPYFANGSILLRRGQKALIDEYKMYPKVHKDDILDALAYAVQFVQPAWQSQPKVEDNPLSFEALLKEINLRGQSRGPWAWHKEVSDHAAAGHLSRHFAVQR